MQHLKETKITPDKGFRATFTNGAQTTSHDAACFFMTMQEKGINPEEIAAYVKMGRMCDPGHEWDEIERIAATFQQARAA